MKVKRVSVTFLIALSLLILNVHPVLAQDNANNKMLTEYQEKKASGAEVYELLDEHGNMLGFYEPYSETNPEPALGIKPRYGANIDWTVSAGKYNYGVNRYTLSDGMKINVKVGQSRTGKSYLTFQNIDTASSLRFNNTETTNGWNGTVTMGGIGTDVVFSFGIENASSQTITYTGSYTL